MHRSLAILWAWMERVQSGGAQEYCKGALKPINNSQCNIEAVTMSGVVFFVLPLFFFSPCKKFEASQVIWEGLMETDTYL